MTDSPHSTPFEAPEPAWLAPLFPGYEIKCLIATGGMGAVYQAVQISLDRPVAIKILPREFGQDQEFRANFETEAKTMARLNHPNLIGVYDFGEVEGMLFIIMEYVPGNSLFHSAHGMAIASDESARIVIGVCQALAHAHEHGILHRDIKPSNILLDQQARPKVGDFGLARPIGAAVMDGETIFGTPHYTAPEVLRSPNSVDARADIFSVGVVLHELLTGRLPADDPRPPSLIARCDPRFDAIIRRATHPSPELRYASATEMAKDISAAARPSNRPRGAVPARGARPLPTRYLPTRYLPAKSASADNSAGVFALLSVIAAAVIVGYLVLRKPAPPPPDAGEIIEVTPPPPAPPPPRKVEPVIKPEPKLETVVVPPAPIPEGVMEDPAPEVAPQPELLPTFDVPGFLDRARTFTRQKATPILATHSAEIEKNFSAFERKVKREVRAMDKVTRGFVEAKVEESLAEWRNDGNRVPKSLGLPGGGKDGKDDGSARWGNGPGASFFKTLTAVHAEYLSKQTTIDDQLEASMAELANSIYLPGLTKQLVRLTDPNEAPSVALIQAEVESVQGGTKYFSALMRGEDPAAAPGL